MKIRLERKKGFTLIELLVVISIIAVLATLAFPAFSAVMVRAAQTTALNNAKQIFYGLKMWAGDNDGRFPHNAGAAFTNANDAYRTLIPDYIGSEKTFYVSKSAWTPVEPDEDTTTATTKLAAGENHWAYVNLLNETSIPTLPIIADGFSSTVGTYASSDAVRGGVWKGKSAIVGRVDGSAKVERLQTTAATGGGTGPSTYEVIGPVGGSAKANIFTTTNDNWLHASQEVVNPAQ